MQNANKETSLFLEGYLLVNKLSEIIGNERYKERLALINEFVPKLEAYFKEEGSRGSTLDTAMRKVLECDEDKPTHTSLIAMSCIMTSVLKEVFSSPPPCPSSPRKQLFIRQKAVPPEKMKQLI